MTADDRVRTGRQGAENPRRRQLLDAAAACFDDVGYAAATIEMIASRAQTSRPTFYAYFKSKDEIFLATVDRVGERLIAAQSLRGMDGVPPRTALTRTTRSYINAIFENGGLVGLIDTVASILPEVAERWDEVTATTVKRMTAFVASIDPGLIDPVVPAERLARPIGDGIHYGAMRLAHAPAAEKERFIVDQIAIMDRLFGFDDEDAQHDSR